MLDTTWKVMHRYPELERLICVALSNQRFAAQLLKDPSIALKRSWGGRQLSPDEQALVIKSAGADDIYDFAARLLANLCRHEQSAPQHLPREAEYIAKQSLASQPISIVDSSKSEIVYGVECSYS